MAKRVLASLIAAGTLVVSTGLRAEEMPAVASPVEMVTNVEFGYALGVPENWQFATSNDPNFILYDPASHAYCGANASLEPKRVPPNEELKEILSKPLGETWWDNILFASVPNRSFVATGVEPDHPGGWPVQRAMVDGDDGDATTVMRARFVAIATVKSQTDYIVMCSVPLTQFEAQKSTIEAIMRSFKITKP